MLLLELIAEGALLLDRAALEVKLCTGGCADESVEVGMSRELPDAVLAFRLDLGSGTAHCVALAVEVVVAGEGGCVTAPLAAFKPARRSRAGRCFCCSQAIASARPGGGN